MADQAEAGDVGHGVDGETVVGRCRSLVARWRPSCRFRVLLIDYFGRLLVQRRHRLHRSINPALFGCLLS